MRLQGGDRTETRDLVFDKGSLKDETRKEFAGTVGAILADTLKPVAARLSRFVQRGLDAVPPARRGAVHLAYGKALFDLGVGCVGF